MSWTYLQTQNDGEKTRLKTKSSTTHKKKVNIEWI